MKKAKMPRIRLNPKASRALGRATLRIKKNSPEILLVVGIAGAVGSTILACRATLHVDEVLEDHQRKMDDIHKAQQGIADGAIDAKEYPVEAQKKDMTVTYVQTAVGFIKLYGPAATLGVMSLVCIVGAHGIMRKRNVALMAAYKTVESAFRDYRKNVVEEYGEEKDYMLRHGLKAQQVTENVTDDDGKMHKVKKDILVAEDPNGASMYTRFFDETVEEYSPNPGYNLAFLRSQQNYWNNILQTKGHVFLNEVYDALGMERSPAGAVVGWVLNGDGDNYIDFGIFDNDNPRARAFVNGLENSIRLDFNVDGVIYDSFQKHKRA